MKLNFIIFIGIFALTGCNDSFSNHNSFNNKANLNLLIDAFLFLSDNHDDLHIMMGEYEGSPIESYTNYKKKIYSNNNNIYLKPIIFGLNNIIVNDDNSLSKADTFDSLVDYYQMGLQIIIEGILKGYGYSEKMPSNTIEYKRIKKYNFQ